MLHLGAGGDGATLFLVRAIDTDGWHADGSFNFYDEGIVSVGGALFATFDAATFNPVTSVNTPVVAPELYEIDPTTGLATLVGPTALGLDALADVNGVVYGFSGVANQVVSLDLATGGTMAVSNIDTAAGVIAGAVPTPEPVASMLVSSLRS